MDPRHSYQTPSNGGVHIAVRWEYASTAARDAASYTTADIGGIARVGSAAPYTFSVLAGVAPLAWTGLGAGSATDGDAIHASVAGEFSAVPAESAPVDGDVLLLEDQSDGGAKRRVALSTLRIPIVLGFAEGEHDGNTYHRVGALVWPGTDVIGTPSRAVASCYVGGSTSTGYIRLYDVESVVVIVEKSFSHQSNQRIDLGPMVGWPTGEALIEVQVRNDDDKDSIEVYALTLYHAT